jgi:hypothetical protein
MEGGKNALRAATVANANDHSGVNFYTQNKVNQLIL